MCDQLETLVVYLIQESKAPRHIKRVNLGKEHSLQSHICSHTGARSGRSRVGLIETFQTREQQKLIELRVDVADKYASLRHGALWGDTEWFIH